MRSELWFIGNGMLGIVAICMSANDTRMALAARLGGPDSVTAC